MEITQFTYFQQVGGIDLKPISVEITYGIERIAMYLQGIDNVYDLEWTKESTTATSTTRARWNFPTTTSKRPMCRCSSSSSTCMKESRSG